MMTLMQFIFVVNLFIFLSTAAHDVTASVAADAAVTTSPLPEALCKYIHDISESHIRVLILPCTLYHRCNKR